ncbi:hypothetical protein SRHO_G00078830 [Serrasalmus rhombeus]
MLELLDETHTNKETHTETLQGMQGEQLKQLESAALALRGVECYLVQPHDILQDTLKDSGYGACAGSWSDAPLTRTGRMAFGHFLPQLRLEEASEEGLLRNISLRSFAHLQSQRGKPGRQHE